VTRSTKRTNSQRNTHLKGDNSVTHTYEPAKVALFYNHGHTCKPDRALANASSIRSLEAIKPITSLGSILLQSPNNQVTCAANSERFTRTSIRPTFRNKQPPFLRFELRKAGIMARHSTLAQTFGERAEQPDQHPLIRYLYRLMELKTSNLCLSADVYTARDLVLLADRLGPSIVVLKTHYDLISGWDYNPQTGTGAKLASLARKHGFLIFEDRKFNDIGKTVQMQYTAGTAHIVEWAHIVNANMSPGPDMVDALADAAAKWRERINYEVRTSVTVGTPVSETYDEEDVHMNGVEEMPPPVLKKEDSADSGHSNESLERLRMPYSRSSDGRKGSIVSITTVTQSFEPADSPRLTKTLSDGDDSVLVGIEEAPFERGLLLLAQMSTKGMLLGPEYTKACVKAARGRKDFVMGFISQESLNSQPEDNFIHMTPGCKLPPEGEEENGTVAGDGLGQQYNTPAKLIGIAGTDVIIVGRGIINAADPQSEAERYRRKGWKAYLARTGRQ
jgi:uridine monophosphate synthetase